MGMCYDADENVHKVAFEIRRDSVKFYDAFYTSEGLTDMIELTKEQLKNIVELCNDEYYEDRIFGVYGKENKGT